MFYVLPRLAKTFRRCDTTQHVGRCNVTRTRLGFVQHQKREERYCAHI
jgi:hypothetical protein